MTIVDEPLLARIRLLRCCWCGRSGPSQPHHLTTRGMGGGSRLDVAINLAPLCHQCHRDHHDGHQPLTVDLLALVAGREGTMQYTIEAAIALLRRVPNRATDTHLRMELKALPRAARVLVRGILRVRQEARS